MKIRNGFVSNSSSSSFLIVGITDTDKIKQLILKDDFVNDGYGTSTGTEFIYTGCLPEECFDENSNIKVDENDDIIEPEYGIEIHEAGIDASERLKTESFKILKKEFVEKAKKLGVEINPDRVQLLYGESSD